MGGKGPLPRNGHPARFAGEDRRYRLLRLIKQDGLGTLWEGEDSFLQCPVAVRLLSRSVVPNRQVIRELRKRLDDLHRRLDHPTIAYVYGYSDSEGPEQFVVMEPLSGETLAQRIRRSGALEPTKALSLAAEIADGLQTAHSIGHTHGGLAGESVVLQRDGSVKIIDFGVAPVTGSNAQGKADSPSSSEPTSREGSPTADVHQLTVLLREMLGNNDRHNAALDLNEAARHSAIELASTLRRAAAEEATRAEEARKASVARGEEASEGAEEAVRRAQEARRAEEAARAEHARRAEEATRAEEDAREAEILRVDIERKASEAAERVRTAH